MHKIKYQIKTLSPILLSSNTGDINMTATCDYIPGSAILGALAGRYIQIKKLGATAHTDNNFYSWFLNSGIIFGNAYPYQKGEYGTKNYLPIPLSIQAEKNSEDKAIDLLQREQEDPNKQRKTISGYGYIAEDIIQRLAPEKSLNFHHSRPDRIKGHSSEGQIFNYESINPEQLFEGEIIGDKPVLQEFVNSIGNKLFIRLGRSRTAQYGQVELKLSNGIEEIDIKNHLSDEIYLVFLSPTILYNENGFPDTSLATLAKYLSDALKIEIKPEQIKSFKKPVEIENFISVWRLKKPSEVAFNAGSCFLIQANGCDDSRIVEIQKRGIGERRGEGFGRVQLKWWQKMDTYTVKPNERAKIEKPDGKMPELTAMIFKEVIKENWKKVIERNALQKYEGFTKHNPPTNSLLSRLEMMLENAKDIEQFLGQICNLRKTARDKLEACRDTNITLLEFIENGNPDFQQIFIQNPELKKMEGEIENSPSTDTEFCNELYKLYWLTFLRMMRKSRKKEATNE